MDDTTSNLVTLFQSLGATLHLSPEGAMTVRPAAVAHAYRPAITRHLCGLLVTAAAHEVQRLMRQAPPGRWDDLLEALVASPALNAACLSGDVPATRAAATAYVAAWTAWLHGEEEPHA